MAINPTTLTLQHRLLSVLNVRKEESDQVKWLFLHHFFQGFGLALFFTVANTLFLSHHSIRTLPLVYIMAGGALLVVGRVYAWLEHKLPVRTLMPLVVVVLFSSVLLSRWGVGALGATAMGIVLLVLHRVIYLLTSLEFWGISALMLDVRQGKRLFGLISAGDVPAKLLGYLSVAVLVPFIGLNNLLVVAAFSFLASLLVLSRIIRLKLLGSPDDNHGHSHHHEEHTDATSALSVMGLLQRLFKGHFIAAMAGLSFLAVAVFTFIDFAFLEEVQARFETETELAFFLGLFFSLGKGFTILTKVFFSGRIIDRLGVKQSLLLLPVLLLVLSLTLMLWGIIGTQTNALFWIFGVMMLVAETFRYTLHDPMFLALFQPLSPHLRLHGHTTVKGLVDPVALGIAGGALLLFLHLQNGVNVLTLNYLLAVLLVGWVTMVFVTSRGYLQVLSNAIQKRFLYGGQITVTDKQALAVLKLKLESAYPEEVIYAVELLQKSGTADLPDILMQLLQHRSEEVQLYVLKIIENLGLKEAYTQVLDLVEQTDSLRVKEAAIRIASQLNEEELSQMMPYLEDEQVLVRKGAITGLMKSGDIEAVVLAGQQLLQLVNADSAADRALAATIIGDLRIRNFYKPINQFISDPDLSVRRQAIEAAGKIGNERLLPQLFGFLSDRELAEEASRAIASYQDAALDHLAERLRQSKADVEQLVRYSQVCSKIGGPKAQQILLELLDHPHRRMRNAGLKGLRTLGYQVPETDRPRFLIFLESAMAHGYWCLRSSLLLRAEPELEQVQKALEQEGIQVQVQIFNLLGLLYKSDAILRCRVGLQSGRREEAANALEILDNLLPKKYAVRLGHLLEDLDPEEKLLLLAPHFVQHQEDVSTLLEYILRNGTAIFHRWTVATVLYALPKFELPQLTPLAESYATSGSLLLRQTALTALQPEPRLEPAFAHHTLSPKPTMETAHAKAGALLEIEKVVVLKSTSIFAETPDNILVDVAAILHEKRVPKGQVIFRKGDLGSNMYIIYQGDIRIHDGDHTFATLHNRDIFGELALLDPEPRSATATAETDCLLLRLDQDAFYELMADRREVVKGVLKVLCSRLRTQNELITRLKRG